MQYDITTSIRRLEPRWRSLSRTPVCEVISDRKESTGRQSMTMQRYLKRWDRNKTLVEAADVVDAAISSGDYSSAVTASLSIVKDDHAQPALKKAALQILGQSADRPVSLLSQIDEWNDKELFPAIAKLKQRLSLMPRDALTALEIARLQSQVGQRKSAVRYIERALAAAPNDRYVLRSAANFFSYKAVRQDAGLISQAIANSDVVRRDPWVQAAEIAVANICGQSPKWALRARKNLDHGVQNPMAFSELASGLAVFEFAAGSPKRNVNKLLRISLQSPTENSLAQAISSKREIGLDLDVSRHLANIDNAYEARARAAYEKLDYKAAVEQSWEWLQDQHLSPTAAMYGAFISTSLLADYQKSVLFSDYGLKANPNNPVLLNTKLVALAFLGRANDAAQLLPRLQSFENDVRFRPFVMAARGLVAFRQGAFMQGREWYSRAIQAARDFNQPTLVPNAVMYWIEQELMAGTISADEARVVVDKLDQTYSSKGYSGEKAATWNARRKIVTNLVSVAAMKHEILTKYSRPQNLTEAHNWVSTLLLD